MDRKAIETAIGLDYAPDGLSPNRSAVGEHLNRAGRLDPGDATTHVLHPMTQIRRTAIYERALEELSPAAYDAPLRDLLQAADILMRGLLKHRCPDGRPAAEPARSGCFWTGIEYRQYTRGRDDERPRFRESAYGLRGYFERPFASSWTARLAASVER